MGSVAIRVLTGDPAGVGFLAGDPVARAVTCPRAGFGARAARGGRCVCAPAGGVSWA